jgi:hypothetical protein
LKNRLTFSVVAFWAVVFSNAIYADEPPLPGHSLGLAEVARECAWAVVAKLTGIGSSGPGPPGMSDYESKWKIIKVLRGNFGGEDKLNFQVQDFPLVDKERLPTVGNRYILVGYGKGVDPKQVAIMIEESEETDKRVVQLLANPKM